MDIHQQWVSADELNSMIRTGQIIDEATIAARAMLLLDQDATAG